VIAYRGCPMEQLAAERAQGVPNRPGGGGRCAENAKKMLFSGNELKNLLEIKDLAFFRPQNELVFECKKRPSKRKRWPKTRTWTPCARLPCRHSERSGTKNLALDFSADQQQGEMLRGVYPGRQSEILRFAQNDRRSAQNDSERDQHDRPESRTRSCKARPPVSSF